MKAPKNLEGIFIVAAALSTFAAFATAEVPVVHSAAPAAQVSAASENMQVVEVKARRLSAAEKAALQ